MRVADGLADRSHTDQRAEHASKARAITSALRNTYNQVEFDVLFDVTSKLTLRGGYRYVWGDSSSFVLPVSGLITAGIRRSEA